LTSKISSIANAEPLVTSLINANLIDKWF